MQDLQIQYPVSLAELNSGSGTAGIKNRILP